MCVRVNMMWGAGVQRGDEGGTVCMGCDVDHAPVPIASPDHVTSKHIRILASDIMTQSTLWLKMTRHACREAPPALTFTDSSVMGSALSGP